MDLPSCLSCCRIDYNYTSDERCYSRNGRQTGRWAQTVTKELNFGPTRPPEFYRILPSACIYKANGGHRDRRVKQEHTQEDPRRQGPSLLQVHFFPLPNGQDWSSREPVGTKFP